MLSKLKIIGASILSVLIAVLTLSFLRPGNGQGKAGDDLKRAVDDSERVSEDIEEVQKERVVLKEEDITPSDAKSEDFWNGKL